MRTTSSSPVRRSGALAAFVGPLRRSGPLAAFVGPLRRSGALAASCAALFSFSVLAEPAVGEWRSANTNGVAQWKAAHGAPTGFRVDAARRTAVVLAEATGLKRDETVEFLAIDPASDRAYESLFVLAADVAELAAALEKAGLPRGRPVSERAVRLWPQGEPVSLSVRRVGETNAVAFADVLEDLRADGLAPLSKTPLLYAGGLDAARGFSFFSTYSHNESLLQLDGRHEQSVVYGRFRPKEAWPKGTLFELELSWRAEPRVLERVVTIGVRSDLAAEIAALRASCAGRDAYVQVAFSNDVTLARATDCARAFKLLDGSAVKMNGFADGEFYYGAFLPEEKWRVRAGRIFQPFEIRFARAADGSWKKTFTLIDEDWSGDGDEPVLVPHETAFSDWSDVPALMKKGGQQASKIAVAFLYAPADTPLSVLKAALALRPRITTFYVFPDPRPDIDSKL